MIARAKILSLCACPVIATAPLANHHVRHRVAHVLHRAADRLAPTAAAPCIAAASLPPITEGPAYALSAVPVPDFGDAGGGFAPAYGYGGPDRGYPGYSGPGAYGWSGGGGGGAAAGPPAPGTPPVVTPVTTPPATGPAIPPVVTLPAPPPPVSGTPEPGAWAMLIVGFAGVGMAARVRRTMEAGK